MGEMAVYSGGNCEVLSKLIGARGKDVLYVGDHIFGDVVKSKKIRGWRTFLIVPELNEELNVWTSKQELWQDLEKFDQKLSLLTETWDRKPTSNPMWQPSRQLFITRFIPWKCHMELVARSSGLDPDKHSLHLK